MLLKRFIYSIVILANISFFGRGYSQIITNFAGGGASLGDNGPATNALVSHPASSGFDSIGNFYFFQSFGAPRIRMIDTSGVIHTVAGNGIQGYSGDGGLATNAELNHVNGIAIDRAGNIYIADYGNYRIRKVNATTHIITTICGKGVISSTGDNGPAVLATIVPYAVCVDETGAVYVIDGNNATIRKIDTFGVITRFAGNGIFGCSGDNGPAINASLSPGNSICFSPSGTCSLVHVQIEYGKSR